MSLKFDFKELANQHREELLNTEHAVALEVVIPPIDLHTILKDGNVAPSVRIQSNGATNAITIAMLLFTLEGFMDNELEDETVAGAYNLIKSMMDCKHVGSTEFVEKRGEKNSD